MVYIVLLVMTVSSSRVGRLVHSDGKKAGRQTYLLLVCAGTTMAHSITVLITHQTKQEECCTRTVSYASSDAMNHRHNNENEKKAMMASRRTRSR